MTLIEKIRPDEVYHLAAQSHVRVSFDEPEYTGKTPPGSARRGCSRPSGWCGVDTRYYQAVVLGDVRGATPPPQNEDTPFYPRSPYGAAKVYGYWMARNYREAHGLFAVNGILFNTSPREGDARPRPHQALGAWIARGRVCPGNTPACRHRAYVLATGTATTVREFTQGCFERVGLDWEHHVRFDEAYLRPTEVDALIGDASKAMTELGWKAQTMPEQLAHLMVDADGAALARSTA